MDKAIELKKEVSTAEVTLKADPVEEDNLLYSTRITIDVDVHIHQMSSLLDDVIEIVQKYV